MRFKCAETIIICLQSSRPLLGPHWKKKDTLRRVISSSSKDINTISQVCSSSFGWAPFFSLLCFFCSLLARGGGRKRKESKCRPRLVQKKKEKKTVGVFFFYTSFYLYIFRCVCSSTRVKKSKKKRERERTNAYIYTHIYIYRDDASRSTRSSLRCVDTKLCARGCPATTRCLFFFPFLFLSFFLSFFL